MARVTLQHRPVCCLRALALPTIFLMQVDNGGLRRIDVASATVTTIAASGRMGDTPLLDPTGTLVYMVSQSA